MNHMTVKGPVTSPLVELDTLLTTDAFVDQDCETLYIVVTPPGHRALGTIDCLRLYPIRGTNRFSKNLKVHPVDIQIEWSFHEDNTPTD